jgi:hypothetical protein
MTKNELCKREDLKLKLEGTVGQQNPIKNNGGRHYEFYSKREAKSSICNVTVILV